MFRQHKWHLSCIKTEIRRVADDSGWLSEHLALSNLPIFLMKALKEEPPSCTESFPTAAPTFEEEQLSKDIRSFKQALRCERKCSLAFPHTPSASKNATKRVSERKVVC